MGKLRELFHFGEKVKGFPIRVLNEREVRAASGILLVLAMISFFNAFLLGNYHYLRVFVLFFFIDFAIRILFNPKFSPTMIVARIVVQNQTPEYVGAVQKKFAWSIGLVMASIMMYLAVVEGIRGPINLLICTLCLIFLFLESAFGICLGCILFKWVNPRKATLCAGGVCEIKFKHDIQKISSLQILIVIVFFFAVLLLLFFGSSLLAGF